MKLLSKNEAKEVRQADIEYERLRQIRIAKKRLDEERALEELRDNYNPEKRKMHDEFETFKKKYVARKSKLLREIDELEAKREMLLISDIE